MIVGRIEGEERALGYTARVWEGRGDGRIDEAVDCSRGVARTSAGGVGCLPGLQETLPCSAEGVTAQMFTELNDFVLQVSSSVFFVFGII